MMIIDQEMADIHHGGEGRTRCHYRGLCGVGCFWETERGQIKSQFLRFSVFVARLVAR